MTNARLLITTAGTCLLAMMGSVAAAGSGGIASTAAMGNATTTLIYSTTASTSPDEKGERRDDDDDDDDRPYRNSMRKVEQRQGGSGPGCAGYLDDDDDGVCDHCARTPKGCASTGSTNPYAGKPSTQDYENQTTIANMQAAFNGESNAGAKYLAFAQKADEEGYSGVASLFRAAASAEGVHAENHAEVIRQLGGNAEATIDDIQVGTTRENLEAAIAGESYEWDVMYPGMLNRARRDRDRAALRSFNFAMTAEREHAKFYRAALENLDGWKEARTFYVCTVCGETVATLDFKKCPSCFVKVDEYVKVN